MKINVLLEPMNGKGFRASSGPPFSISLEAETRQQVLDEFKEAVRARLRAGGEIVTLEVDQEDHPLMRFAGIFDEKDPLIQEWLKEVEKYRKEVDADADRP